MSDGSVTIDVTLTKEQFDKALKDLGYDLEKLGKKNSSFLSNMSKGFNTLGDTFTGIGNTFKKASGVVIGALAGITAGLGTAVSRYDTIKNFPKVMSNLGIEAEASKKSIDALSKGIDGLPTALDDAVSGVSRLVAKNQDIDKSTKYFLAMNNAIVAGNAPMELQKSALEQLTQAYTKGKADMMEWRTMMMAMPGQLTQVAKAFGISTDDLYEKLKKGKISMDDFMAKIVELNENGVDGFQSFAEQAKNSTDSIGTAITNLGNRIKKGFATILESIDTALNNTSLGSVAGLINTVSETIRDAMAKIGTAIENSQAFKDFIERLAESISKLQEKINNVSPEQLGKMVDIFIKLIEWAPKLFLIGEGFTIIGKSMKSIGGALSTIEKLHGLMDMIPNKVLLIVGIIALITGALIYLYNTNEDFRNAVQEGIAIVQQVFQTLWEMLQPIFESIKEQLGILMEKLQPVIDFLKAVLPPIIETIIVVLGTLIATIILIIAKVVEIGTYVFNFIADVIIGIVHFFTDTIPNAIKFVFDKISSFISMVIEVVTHLDYYIGYVIGLIIGKVVQCVMDIWNFITVKIPATIMAIIKYISELPGKIWEWLQKAYQKFVEWGNNMMKKGTESAKKTGDNIINALKELPGKVIEVGRNIVEGLWNGISGAWGWIVGKVSEFARGILDGMKASLGINSPSRLFRDQVGKNIALGVGEGFEETISKVYQNMERAISNETSKLSNEMVATGNVSIERNANITSLLNGIIEQDSTFTSNVVLDGRVVASAVNKVNKRNAFAQGIA